MGDLGIVSAIRLIGMVWRLGPVRHATIMGELALDDRGTDQFSGTGNICGRTVGGSDVRNRNSAAQELCDLAGAEGN